MFINQVNVSIEQAKGENALAYLSAVSLTKKRKVYDFDTMTSYLGPM
jgi:hypothetical protein